MQYNFKPHCILFLLFNLVTNDEYSSCVMLTREKPKGGISILGGGGLAPKFSSEIRVGSPNFASKNIGDNYPKFCPLNFRYDPKIGILS